MSTQVDCEVARATMIDESLGQADGAAAAMARAHVDRCAECRREVPALRETVQLLRRQTGLLPSPRFRARVGAALDAVDAAATTTVSGPKRGLDRSVLRAAAAVVALVGGGALAWRAWFADDPSGSGSNAGTSAQRKAGTEDDSTDSIPFARARPPVERGTIPPRPDLLPREPPSGLGREPLSGGRNELPAPATPDGLSLEDLWQQAPGELVEMPPLDRRAPSPLDQRDPARRTQPIGPTVSAPESTPVRRALEWLARSQRSDGSWTPGQGEPGLDTGVTAIALLALEADGHLGTAFSGSRADPLDVAVERAVAYLRSRQDSADGTFVGGHDEATATFCHGVTCLALVEHHVRSFAAGVLDAAAEKRERARLEHALSRLEILLDRILDSDSRCSGNNAAWAALALSTARHSGLDFKLRPSGERLVEDVLKRLRLEQPALMLATSRTIVAMAERDAPAIAPNDLDWARAVAQVLEKPEQVEPSLRFLVASALSGTGAHDEQGQGPGPAAGFQATIAERLGALQREAGYFDSMMRWDCFDGGTVNETSLAVLTLSVERRHQDWATARARLHR